MRSLSHGLVALAVLSLPASMAMPTATLLQAVRPAPGQPIPADNPAAAIANERFFTDNEVANDPDDYPVAAFLAEHFSLRRRLAAAPTRIEQRLYREIPAFTAFWFDQTATVLTFDATDTFGVIVSRLAHVRANLAFSLMVFLYKLLCALVLVAVTFDTLLGPAARWLGRKVRRRGPDRPAPLDGDGGGETSADRATPAAPDPRLEPAH